MSLPIRILCVVGVSLLLVGRSATPALAGIEPQPWKPQVHKLDEVAKHLDKLQDKINDALMKLGIELTLTDVEPAPMGFEPQPWKPVVHKLDQVSHKLDELIREVNKVLAADELGVPELEAAFMEVRAAAQRIVDATTPTIGMPDGDVLEALLNVNGQAQLIVSLADGYLGPGH